MSANTKQVGNTNEFVSIDIKINANTYYRIGTDCINSQADLDNLKERAIAIISNLRIAEISGFKPLGGV